MDLNVDWLISSSLHEAVIDRATRLLESSLNGNQYSTKNEIVPIQAIRSPIVSTLAGEFYARIRLECSTEGKRSHLGVGQFLKNSVEEAAERLGYVRGRVSYSGEGSISVAGKGLGEILPYKVKSGEMSLVKSENLDAMLA